MHGAPLRAWSLPSLAAKAGMSRTAFAVLFTSLVGEPPMRYLARLRLGGAALRLRQTNTPIREIAESAGYESEASLGKAFKREFGEPPPGTAAVTVCRPRVLACWQAGKQFTGRGRRFSAAHDLFPKHHR